MILFKRDIFILIVGCAALAFGIYSFPALVEAKTKWNNSIGGCEITYDSNTSPFVHYWLKCRVPQAPDKPAPAARGVAAWNWIYAEYGFDGKPDALNFHSSTACELIETELPGKPYRAYTVECGPQDPDTAPVPVTVPGIRHSPFNAKPGAQ